MKICMLSDLFYPYLVGGAERRYFEIAKRLSKKNEITVYSLNFHGSPKEEIFENIKIKRVGISHSLHKRNMIPLATYFKVFLKDFSKFDIVDANQGISSFIGLNKCFSKRPVVATFHDIYWNQWSEHFKMPYSYAGKIMEFTWSKFRYDTIFTVSPRSKEKMQHLGFKAPIKVITSGIDLDLIDSIKAKRQERSVVFVGRLVKYKNVDTLIKAVSKIKKTRLYIIGSGPEENNLKALAKNLNADVKFCGFIDEKEKIKIIKSANVLVNFSDIEGLGLILIESMACGTPVIAKPLDSYFFCNDENCILAKNEEDLSAKIEQLLDDPVKARKIAQNARNTAIQYSWDNVAKEVEKVYKSLLV